jgi:hypothetical protein
MGGQVTSPLLSAQGEAYDSQYGIFWGELSGRFGDQRYLGMFGDPQDLEGDGFEDAREFVTKTVGDTVLHSGNTSWLFIARQAGGGSASTAPTIRGPGNVGGSSPGVLKVSSPTVSA